MNKIQEHYHCVKCGKIIYHRIKKHNEISYCIDCQKDVII